MRNRFLFGVAHMQHDPMLDEFHELSRMFSEASAKQPILGECDMLTYEEQKELARIHRERSSFFKSNCWWIVATAALVGAMMLASGIPGRAADLPVKAAPFAPVAAYTWNGIWLGVRAGYGVNATNAGSITDGLVTIDFGAAPKGIVGGLNGGLDFQLGPSFVAGLYIEQDFAGLCTSTNVGGISLANLTNYLGAAGGRLGCLVTP